MSTSGSRLTNYDLPQDLLSLLLVRLPVKALLQFRCVSKSWLDLIDSSYFVNLHQCYSKQHHESVKIMTAIHFPYFCVLEFDPRDSSKAKGRMIKRSNINVGDSIEYAGACNGLICLVLHKKGGNHNTVAIWNPSTKKCRERVMVTRDFGYDYYRLCCFGYDRKTDDYKFVTLIQCVDYDSGGELVSESNIYSIRSDSWSRQRKRSMPVCILSRHSIFARGAVHCIAHNPKQIGDDDDHHDYKFSVASFDLATGDWSEILVPLPAAASHESLGWHLSTLDDSVTATYCNNMEAVEVWMMITSDDDQGVQNSWSKLFSFSDFVSRFFCVYGCGCRGSLALYKIGQQVLVFVRGRGGLKWYDIESKILKTVKVSKRLIGLMIPWFILKASSLCSYGAIC